MKLFAAFPSGFVIWEAIKRLARGDLIGSRYEILMVKRLAGEADQPALITTTGLIEAGVEPSANARILVNYPCQVINALMGRGLHPRKMGFLVETMTNSCPVLVLQPESKAFNWEFTLREAGAIHVVEADKTLSFERGLV